MEYLKTVYNSLFHSSCFVQDNIIVLIWLCYKTMYLLQDQFKLLYSCIAISIKNFDKTYRAQLDILSNVTRCLLQQFWHLTSQTQDINTVGIKRGQSNMTEGLRLTGFWHVDVYRDRWKEWRIFLADRSQIHNSLMTQLYLQGNKLWLNQIVSIFHKYIICLLLSNIALVKLRYNNEASKDRLLFIWVMRKVGAVK